MKWSRDGGNAGGGPSYYFRPFALPDSLYRLAARRMIAYLLAENARLKRRPRHQIRYVSSDDRSRNL